jgi:hypothetical protein
MGASWGKVPIPGNPRLMKGSAIGGSMSTDLYSRRLGFDLGYRLVNSTPVFLSVGVGANARVNVY